MQSFFIASVHFSVQNRGMHEEKEEKQGIKQKVCGAIKRFGVWNILCSGLFLMVMVAVAGAFLYPHRHTQTDEWGERATGLPWRGEGLEIVEVTRGWRAPTDNKWMKDRDISDYPFIELTLGNCTGSGTVFVHFRAPGGHIIGKPVALPYRNGQFVTESDPFCRTEGKKATVNGYPGYTDPHQFILHCLNEDEPHWQVHVSHSPQVSGAQNRTLSPLGFATIPKKTIHQ